MFDDDASSRASRRQRRRCVDDEGVTLLLPAHGRAAAVVCDPIGLAGLHDVVAGGRSFERLAGDDRVAERRALRVAIEDRGDGAAADAIGATAVARQACCSCQSGNSSPSTATFSRAGVVPGTRAGADAVAAMRLTAAMRWTDGSPSRPPLATTIATMTAASAPPVASRRLGSIPNRRRAAGGAEAAARSRSCSIASRRWGGARVRGSASASAISSRPRSARASSVASGRSRRVASCLRPSHRRRRTAPDRSRRRPGRARERPATRSSPPSCPAAPQPHRNSGRRCRRPRARRGTCR